MPRATASQNIGVVYMFFDSITSAKNPPEYICLYSVDEQAKVETHVVAY